ncbi:ABC transporter permease [Paraburkholderia graminis]|jgi:putative spermidine/putrescine transport system permease protein|uniref:Binding-protein-dependent transport systems inner membrane component n=2 Tax=Paraburkholderia graminis TaxID=60548 RepID=B1G358_PARG4|nr:ABC transporter permease [Paraburkholderia graminis]AXF11086.1 ABC transporter permease [Paraburkholderia graminis]EDT09417.1 binding-protein-dependent transport systems inner membrane component [Paraburkholderia graminis C4D1M]MDQ0625657.1 putative spermidine/putrescine transport system permease protein [Paraburkholderia graminis]MDR6204182.1 putative spermidine/putrescine transport system permease protein [Paraburkholderia graminis]MDR6471737.1 putative spermidine/putrescine transport sys
MATLDDDRPGAAPWLLSGPALLLFIGLLLVPLLLTLMLSFRVFSDTAGVTSAYTLTNYWEVVSDPYYGTIFLRTAGLAFAVTLLSIVLGVPETIVLARMKRPWQSLCLLVVLGPLLISVVVRTLGWQILLGNNGVLNNALQSLHITDEPVRLVFTMTGMIIALTHVLVPFMVMSVWATMQKLDPQIEWAGRSLGGSPFAVFRRVVLPQIMPGVLSGSIIVFALSASAFATPALIGGRRLKVVATAAYDEFLGTLNWPLGASIAVLLLIANVAIVMGCSRLAERRFRHIFD